MTRPLFDENARRHRRARADSLGGDLFLHARALDECLDRLADIRRDFTSAMVVGRLPETLKTIALTVRHIDRHDTDLATLAPSSLDLIVTIGELDHAEDLAGAALTYRHLLRPGGLLIGAIVGGASLSRLRGAMIAADRAGRGVAPRFHPTIDGPSLAALLTSVGLVEPVIDVDRVSVSYPSFDRLVTDLRAMGCTNILTDRSRVALTRTQVEIARAAFLAGADRVSERFDLIHFAAWAPQI